MSSDRLNFISYSGKYPNLCSGQLIMKLDGKVVVFPRYCLCSGGNVSFDDEWTEEVSEGPWTITEFPKDFPEELKARANEIVNENVPLGCCGGCV